MSARRPHAHLHHHPHDGAPGPGHNTAPRTAVPWQTPHLPAESQDAPRRSDESRDLDLVEQAFCEGFAAASDPTSFLRLAGVPFVGAGREDRTLHLLRVEREQATDVGSITPHLGGGSFRYAPLPSRLTGRRETLRFVYLDGAATVRLSLEEARALIPASPDRQVPDPVRIDRGSGTV